MKSCIRLSTRLGNGKFPSLRKNYGRTEVNLSSFKGVNKIRGDVCTAYLNVKS